ncbi:MAG: hypothetical protein ACR2KV_11860 [Solirubrobacteraceae bacterium]
MDPRDVKPPAPKPGRPRVMPTRTAAAVIGSVAALGGAGSAAAQVTGHPAPDRQRRQGRRAEAMPAGERALLTRVFSALSAQAPAIARPTLAAGVGDGTITQADEDRFLARLESVRTAEHGAGPTAGAGRAAARAGAPPSLAAQTVFQRALAAVRAELPVVAAPMVSAALADGSITAAQATRLSARFGEGPRLGFGLVMRGARSVGATRLP